MILTGAAFGVQSTVWLASEPLRALTRLASPEAELAQLQAFNVRCVALAEALASAPVTGVEPLSVDQLRALKASVDQVLVL